jgi:hydroxypyruvate reductase
MFTNRQQYARTSGHEVALDCLAAGIDAARPSTVVQERVTYDSDEDSLVVAGESYDLTGIANVYVVGGGNAAGAIAPAIEEVLDSRLTDGAVVTDAPRETTRIETLRGDHPVPSELGVENTARMRSLAADAGADDLVLAVIGGGGSALMAAPVDGVSLDALRSLTKDLLASGATIDEINAVRKHLSDLKGGQLARTAAPATVVGVVLSDVVGDDLSVIASGPTAPDPTTYEDALRVLDQYDVDAPASVRAHLENGADGKLRETPGPKLGLFEHVTNHIIANGRTAIRAAGQVASERGYTLLVLSSSVRGEAREVAKVHAAVAEECQASGEPVEPPAVLISGGETTVTVRSDGTGGPNQELALSGALEISPGVVLGSVDTDGLDGSTDAAGALVDASTVTEKGRAQSALDANDAYPLLDEHDALLFTGETGTNVNDLRILVVEE